MRRMILDLVFTKVNFLARENLIRQAVSIYTLCGFLKSVSLLNLCPC